MHWCQGWRCVWDVLRASLSILLKVVRLPVAGDYIRAADSAKRETTRACICRFGVLFAARSRDAELVLRFYDMSLDKTFFLQGRASQALLEAAIWAGQMEIAAHIAKCSKSTSPVFDEARIFFRPELFDSEVFLEGRELPKGRKYFPHAYLTSLAISCIARRAWPDALIHLEGALRTLPLTDPKREFVVGMYEEASQRAKHSKAARSLEN